MTGPSPSKGEAKSEEASDTAQGRLHTAGEAYFQTVFEHAADGILIADSASNYLDANPSMCAMLGYAHAELVGLHASDIVVTVEHKGNAATLAAILGGTDYQRAWRFRRKDGSQFDAEALVSTLPDGNIVACIRDMGGRREAEASSRHLAAIVESSEDAITSTTLDSIITSWNNGAERMSGHSADAVLGQPLTVWLPAECVDQDREVVAAILRDEHVSHFESCRLHKDGSRIIVSSSASPIRDALGSIIGISRISRDITTQRKNEREIARLGRLYAALSQINQAIVFQKTRPALLQKVCDVLVEFGEFRLAWIGMVDPPSLRILPQAKSGDAHGYVEQLEVFVDDRPQGRGPIGMAFRDGCAHVCLDTLADPTMQPWQPALERNGLRAAAAIPIREGGVVSGTLNVYTSDPLLFGEREIALLEEAAGDLSFALDNLNREGERKRVEAAMEEERLFSTTMLESMPGILYFHDFEGRMLRWNRNLERVTGYTCEQITTMHSRDFNAADERQLVQERIDEVLEDGESFVEASLRCRDGSQIPYLMTGRRLVYQGAPCMVGIGIDISQRKLAEARLREAELRFHTLFDCAPVGVLVCDPESATFIEYNDQAASQLGYTRDGFTGLGVNDIQADASPAQVRARIDALMRDGHGQHETQHRTRTGQLRDVLVTSRLIELAGRQLLQCVYLDITERKQAEARLRELNETLESRVIERTSELQAALLRADASDRLKSAFLATMSHELRTPLNSIIGFTGILLQGLPGPINDEQTKQLGMVRGSARHLLALINDVLDISKIEAGELEVRLEAFDLPASIQQVTDSLRPLALAKGIALEVTTDAALIEMVSDRRRVEQILLNLLGNALKFTEHGAVRVTAERVDHRLTDPSTASGPIVRLSVTDSGPGIRAEDLPLLFQPFQQLDTGIARKHEGTGLGLAICKRLAMLLGGTMAVESTWQQGSTFSLTLPLTPLEGP